MPQISCDHNSREQMFYTTVQGAYECYKLWKVESLIKNDWVRPSTDILDEMDLQPVRLQWIKNISIIFLNQRNKCSKCSLQTEVNNVYSEDMPARAQREQDLIVFTSEKKTLQLPDPLPLVAAVVGNALAQEPKESQIFINFDDYGSAPLSIQQTPLVLNTWTFDSSGFLVIPKWASSWKDQGYRLAPDFDCISSQKDPTDYTSRLFPFEKEPTDTTPHSSETKLTLKENKNLTTHTHNDKRRESISMSAESMLQEAGSATKTNQSRNVFIRGKTIGEDFINLDMEKDHLPLTQEKISISVDIDSILWITRGIQFSCKGAINLHLKPHYSSLPPFSANPSVYVTLLEPPNDEAELRQPQSRSRARFPLSSIPHMPFGYFGEATQQFNLYVFFPRMIHKNNNNHQHITLMPQELQELWLS